MKLADRPYHAHFATATLAPTVTYNGFGMASTGGTLTVRSGSFTRTVVIPTGFGGAKVQ